MKYFNDPKQNNLGLTLIELLIVVVVLGTLAGLSVSIINPLQQEERARDGVRLSKIKTVAESIESYNQIEYSYPPDTSITNSDSLLYEVYLDKWPGDEYKYSNIGGGFVMEVENSLGGCYKYQSSWTQVMRCPETECALLPTQSPDESVASDCSDL